MNDFLIKGEQIVGTFAAYLIHKSTNQLKNQQWNN